MARCHRILALPLNAEGEAGERAIQLGNQLLLTPVYGLTSKAVRRWVGKVFNCLNGEIPKLGPFVVLHGLYHKDWTAKERAWVEAIPVVGTPSIPVLRQTMALAELKVLDLHPCDHGVCDETDCRGSGLCVSLRSKQENLTEHEVRLKMFHAFRLAGFEVNAFRDVEISLMKRSWMVVGHVVGGCCDRLRRGDGSGRPPGSLHHPPACHLAAYWISLVRSRTQQQRAGLLLHRCLLLWKFAIEHSATFRGGFSGG